MRHSRRRWGNDDRFFGPFTYSVNRTYRNLSVMLDSGDSEDAGCSLRLSAFGHTLIVALPPVIKPWRRWVDTPNGGYWDEHERNYGFCLHEGFLQIRWGAQTHDSTTTQDWCWHLPWTQWRHYRHSLYDRRGKLLRSFYDGEFTYNEERKLIERIETVDHPFVTFQFRDFDGERITARTRIEEREWRFGTGWWWWLSLFRAPKIHRYLDISFSKETGPRKGSWKGGTVGHSINMTPGDLHESAFRRYCAEHNMIFDGVDDDRGREAA